MSKIYTSADQLIGHTPLLELTHIEAAEGLEAKLLAAIPRQGIIHIQHQGGDTVLAQELRRDGLNGTENIFRGKKHRQTTLL